MAFRGVVAVDTVQEIRDLSHTLRRNLGILVPEKKKVYVYWPSSVEADDGDSWLKPTVTDCDCCKNRGRWKGYDFCCSGDEGGGGGGITLPISESDVSGLEADLADLVAADAAEALTRAADDATLAAAISSEASARATADGLLVPKSRVLTTTAPLKIAGGASADLSVDRTLSVDAATTSAPGVVTLATPSADVTAGHVIQGNDARLSDARTPTAHAMSHKNGGGDEVATATPGANEIPKANAGGKLAAGWGGSASTLATLDAGSKVVENPANATAMPTASKIPIADGSGKLDAGWGGAASTLATLNASTKVVEDPANATATPTASKIVIASAGGKVDSWVSDAAAGVKGLIELDTDLGGTAAAPKVVAITETSGPTQLVIGTVTDGEYLKRSGGTLISGSPGLTTQDKIDLLWGKKFFSDEGFLPANKIFEYVGTPTAFSGTPSGTLTLEPGAARSSGAATGYYDMGAAKSEILVVIGNLIRNGGNQIALGFCNAAPSGADPNDTYFVYHDSAGPGIWKKISGTFTSLGAQVGVGTGPDLYGLALHYKDSTNALTSFLRFGSQWFKLSSGSDSALTTLRYILLQTNGAGTRFCTPFVCYAA